MNSQCKNIPATDSYTLGGDFSSTYFAYIPQFSGGDK
jgi:hypothetical protein